MSKKYKYHGFTLAETLITLIIIGVIASLTLPTLMSKYKKIETASRLKQVYSRLQNATEIAMTNTGLEPAEWLTDEQKTLSDSEKKQFVYETYIKPYLKTVNYDKNEGSFFDESGAKYTFGNGHNAPGFWTPQVTQYPGSVATLKVDINGNKGKNEDGYDIFYFMYKPKNEIYFSNPKGYVIVLQSCGAGLQYSFEDYKNFAYYGAGTSPACHQTRNSRGCCGDIIMREGWQIKDDYPIKF